MLVLPRFVTHLSRATAFVLALSLSSLAAAASPALDRIVEQGVLKVAMSGNQQPFNFTYGKKKSLVGIDVDLAEQLAGLMKVRLQIVQVPFDKLIDAVESGKVDMVISGMTITAERSRKVSFVGPYMLSGKSVLGTGNTVGKLKLPSSRQDGSGIKLVALKGSTSEDLVRQELPKARLTSVADYDEGVKLLLSGKASGMVADMPILALTRQQHSDADLHLMTPPLSIEPLGIAIARGDEQLENLLRNYLLVFEKTGLLMNLHKKWFELGNSRPYQP